MTNKLVVCQVNNRALISGLNIHENTYTRNQIPFRCNTLFWSEKKTYELRASVQWEIIRPYGMQIAHPPIWNPFNVQWAMRKWNKFFFRLISWTNKESAITLIALIITLVWARERPVIYMLWFSFIARKFTLHINQLIGSPTYSSELKEKYHGNSLQEKFFEKLRYLVTLIYWWNRSHFSWFLIISRLRGYILIGEMGASRPILVY